MSLTKSINNSLVSSKMSQLISMISEEPKKNITCKDCNSDIFIESIKEEEEDFKISYICENDHIKRDEPLCSFFDYINNQSLCTQRGKCQNHPKEEISYYCEECKENICKNCLRSSNTHKNHNYTDLFKDAINIKHIQEKSLDNIRAYIDSMDKTQTNIIEEIDKLKNKIEKYFQKIKNFVNFQYYFISNFDSTQLSYNNIQSTNFLINEIKIEDILPNNFENLKLNELIHFLNDKQYKKNEYINKHHITNNINVIKLKYDIKDISTKTPIFGVDFNAFTPSNCKIFVDDEEIDNKDFDFLYQFKSTGIHKVELNITNNNNLDLKGMFRCCLCLIEADFSNFNSSGVVSLNNTFCGCINLKKVKFNNFYSDKLTDMVSMFSSCKSLETVDLTNFKTPALKAIKYMFFGCSSLKEIDLNSINVSEVVDISYMFYCCFSLEKIHFSKWNTSNIKSMKHTKKLINLEVKGINLFQFELDLYKQLKGCDIILLESNMTEDMTADSMYFGNKMLYNR